MQERVRVDDKADGGVGDGTSGVFGVSQAAYYY